jgi:hypothetical protein
VLERSRGVGLCIFIGDTTGEAGLAKPGQDIERSMTEDGYGGEGDDQVGFY